MRKPPPPMPRCRNRNKSNAERQGDSEQVRMSVIRAGPPRDAHLSSKMTAPHPALRATLSPHAGRGATCTNIEICCPSPRMRGEGARRADEGLSLEGREDAEGSPADGALVCFGGGFLAVVAARNDTVSATGSALPHSPSRACE